MANPAYLTLEGATQGDISSGGMSSESVGTLSIASADQVQVQEFELDVQIPTDPQSGQPTGTRTHKGMRLVKYLDKASPMLLQAISTGETLTTVALSFYRTSAEGQQEHYYTIELTNATLVHYRPYFPMALDPESEPYSHMEELLFKYKGIEVTHEVASTSASDSWDTATPEAA